MKILWEKFWGAWSVVCLSCVCDVVLRHESESLGALRNEETKRHLLQLRSCCVSAAGFRSWVNDGGLRGEDFTF